MCAVFGLEMEHKIIYYLYNYMLLKVFQHNFLLLMVLEVKLYMLSSLTKNVLLQCNISNMSDLHHCFSWTVFTKAEPGGQEEKRGI